MRPHNRMRTNSARKWPYAVILCGRPHKRPHNRYATVYADYVAVYGDYVAFYMVDKCLADLKSKSSFGPEGESG